MTTEEQRPQVARREATLLLKTDFSCRLMVGNDNHGELQKNIPLSVVLPLGDHLISVVTPDGVLERVWTQNLNCEGQSVCLIRLAESYAEIQQQRVEAVALPLGIECLSVDQIHAEQAVAARSSNLTVTFRDGPDTPEMVIIPAGSYRRGEYLNKYRVDIARHFAIGKHPVTVEEWARYVDQGGTRYTPHNNDWKGDNLPVTNVSWSDAQGYIQWLSEQTKQAYRLLTEAEWEYASRAGAVTEYHWGDEVGHNNCNCQDSGSEWSRRCASPVGSFAPNTFGLHDMLGNVWEWLEDIWHDNYEGAPIDGSAWLSGGNPLGRVMRGGSWSSFPTYVRCAHRHGSVPAIRNFNFGFRLARTLA